MVTALRTRGGFTYAKVRLMDGRTLPYVRHTVTLQVGQRVLVRYDSGSWSIE